MKKLSLFFIAGLSFVSANAQNLSVSLSPHQYPNGYNISVHGASDGSINATVNNAVGPVTFEWNDNVTTEDRTNLAAGTYSVLVTDSLDSTATATVTLTQPAAIQPLEIIFQKSTFPGGYNISSFGAANGSISITVTGGQAPYTYLWSNGAITKDVAGLAVGSYTVTVTDNLGTTATGTQTLLQPGQPLSVQITGNTNPCGSAAMNFINAMVSGGTPPYQYQWLMGGVVLPNITSMLNVPPSGGTFEVKVKDANQDSATASYTASMQPPPLMVMVNPIYYQNGQVFSCPTCNDGRLIASVMGGTAPYTFSWTGGSNNDTLTGLAPSPTPYSVTVTDANGCTGYGSYTLANMPPPPPPMTLMITGNISMFPPANNVTCMACTDGYINLNVSGGMMPYTFLWSNGATTQNIGNIGTGIYSVTVTDMNGATANQTFNLMFIPPPPPLMPLMITGNVSMFPPANNVTCMACTDGYINLTVSGGMMPYTFLWSNGATTQNLSNIGTGIYTVTVTDMNGATANQTFNLMFMPPPPPPMGLIVTGNISMFPPGANNVSCLTCTDGYINLTVSGGMPPYTYNWGNGINTQNRSNIGTGMYSVTVTDMMGATVNQSFNLLFYTPPPPAAMTLNVTKSELPGGYNVGCATCTDGYVNIMAMGGMPPYMLYWNNSVVPAWMNGMNINNLGAGTYFIKVVGMNGDSATASVTLIAPSNQLNVQLNSMVWGCGSVNGNINANVMGGTPPYTYQWSGPNGNLPNNWSSINVSQEGTYSVTVTDANSATAQASVNVFPAATVNVEIEAVEQYGEAHTGCTVADGILRIHLQGGQPPYNVNVNMGGAATAAPMPGGNPSPATQGYYFYTTTSDTIIELDSLQPGWYNVWVNDMSMCGNGGGVELMEAESPCINVSGVLYENGYYFSCDSCNDAVMTASATGGYGSYTYTWYELPADNCMDELPKIEGASLFMSEGKMDMESAEMLTEIGTGAQIQGLEPGKWYVLLGVDQLGCSGTVMFSLERPKPLSNVWLLSGNEVDSTSFIGTLNAQDFLVVTNDSLRMVVKSTGEVLIGTDQVPEGYKFAVKGKAIAEEMEVKLYGDWPDYVFGKEYELLSLKELQCVIDEQGHLPGMPSANEVKQKGINLGEMDAMLLEKIEELTLYMLKMEGKYESLEKQNEELKKQIDELRK